MSLVTVGKNGRSYERKFDHEAAQRLRAEGWSWMRLAEHFGVSAEAVRRVCDQQFRAKMDRAAREHIERQREPCKGGCGTRVWRHGKQGRARSGYCLACLGRVRAQSVRETTLRCGECREWKPDEEFPRYRRAKSRRGRHTYCRKCSTIVRRRHRAAKPHLQHAADRRSNDKKRRHLMSEWIIFVPDGDGFKEHARVEATGRVPAVEQIAEGEGPYYAVQAKNFQPLYLEPVHAYRVVAKPESS